MYANTPDTSLFPRAVRRAVQLGGTVGYAHFNGSHAATRPCRWTWPSGAIDFVEVFQFGVLKAEPGMSC